jgi:hypothetical protein
VRYTIDQGAVADDAEEISRAVQDLARVHVGTDLAPVAGAFAGGSTAAGMGRVREAWERQLGAARTDLSGLGAALGAAADGYAEMETQASRLVAGGAGDPS